MVAPAARAPSRKRPRSCRDAFPARPCENEVPMPFAPSEVHQNNNASDVPPLSPPLEGPPVREGVGAIRYRFSADWYNVAYRACIGHAGWDGLVACKRWKSIALINSTVRNYLETWHKGGIEDAELVGLVPGVIDDTVS